MSKDKPTQKPMIKPRRGLGSYVALPKKVPREARMPVDVFMRMLEERMRNR